MKKLATRKTLAVFIFLGFIAFVTRSFLYRPISHRDYNMICTQFKKHVRDGDPSQLNHNYLKWAQHLEENLESDEARDAFEAAATSATPEKLRIFKAAAKKAGLDDWDCPEMNQ